MKTLYSVMAILAASTIIGIVTIGNQQVYAPRSCGSCAEFQKLTDEFEKNVIDAASVNPPDPDRIQTLVGEYSDEVLKLFPSTSP
ncbi:MAG TPA: hypothetical protein VLD84_05170 [Nitrososphaeraceae archaeon]|nr:hypothetical protein [Nitrososphaeraceae archaeon]